MIVIDQDGRIDADLPCFACGYNLRTLKPHATCPECGHAVEHTLSTDNALLMPPFWLGQVFWGSVCFAMAWPLMLLCGFGVIPMLVGILCFSEDAPSDQFRVKHLQEWALWPLLGAGMMLGLIFALVGTPWLSQLAFVCMVMLVTTSLVTSHLIASKTARAARMFRFQRAALVMAILTAVIPFGLPLAMVAVLYLAEWPRLIRGAFSIGLALMIGYLLLEIAFWATFANAMRRVRITALGFSESRGGN